jgi:3',5'-cyclic AMP phosphodiesterase CpdA
VLPELAPLATVNDTTLIAAGDIADCENQGDEATAALLGGIGGTIIALGDLAYDDGTAEDFAECYDPTWGRHKDRTIPVPGNHEYEGGADPYLDYWAGAAAPDGETWYSRGVGSWHVIVVDSNCTAAGGCGNESPQMPWLVADLAANEALCTVVAMHHPRWSSGREHPKVHEMWKKFYQAGVDVVLSAHDHFYERFAPMTPDGEVDDERGIRSFVVGTGGAPLYEFERQAPDSEARSDDTWGVLRLDLRPDSYTWEFVPIEDGDFADGGSGRCH